ncbi:MAG: DMT family transporter [Cyanobacteria bacterium SBLK]|nr:DMT family transporter [Cyanobacteria bacterium SBLK]
MEIANQTKSSGTSSSGNVAIAFIGLCIASVTTSFASIFMVWSERELSATATVFNRFWIAAAVMMLWQVLQVLYRRLASKASSEDPLTYTRRDWGLLLLAGIIYPLNHITWAWSLTQTSVAKSAILHEMSPIFTSLAAWLLFARGFDRRFLLGTIAAMGGAIALVATEALETTQIVADRLQGDSAAFLSAAFFATYLIALEQLRQTFSSTIVLLWISAISALLPAAIALLSGDSQLFPSSLQGWLSVIGLAFCAQIIGQGLTGYSLKTFSSGFVALFSLTIPVISALLAASIFSERLNLLSYAAFGAILLGLYLGISSKSAKQCKES